MAKQLDCLLHKLNILFTRKKRQTVVTTFMHYECPSCFLAWTDSQEPQDKICYPLCSFCSLSHTQKELLNWQINHIENINPSKFPKIFRYFYRFVELKLQLLEDKIYESIREDSHSGKS